MPGPAGRYHRLRILDNAHGTIASRRAHHFIPEHAAIFKYAALVESLILKVVVVVLRVIEAVVVRTRRREAVHQLLKYLGHFRLGHLGQKLRRGWYTER